MEKRIAMAKCFIYPANLARRFKKDDLIRVYLILSGFLFRVERLE